MKLKRNMERAPQGYIFVYRNEKNEFIGKVRPVREYDGYKWLVFNNRSCLVEKVPVLADCEPIIVESQRW